MRDPKRIDVIIDKLNKLWQEFPDMRFWQLISYLSGFIPEDLVGTDPFFWEDDVWENVLNKSLEE